MRKVLACSVAALFALSVPAEALFGGGGGKGSRGGGASSSKSSSSSKSRSTSRGGISAGASVGRGGISAGASIGGARAGASIGGGGVSAGASVGGTSAGASVGRSGAGVSATGGSISAGVNAGAGGVDASISAGSLSVSGSVTTQQGQSEDAHTSAAIATTGNSLLVVLPPELLPQRTSDSETRCEGPLGDCGARGPLLTGRASAAAPAAPQQRLRSEPGTPVPVVTACQRAAADAAQRYGARRVEAAGAGYLRRSGNGGLVAPVMLRITYGEGSAAQIRQAEVSCAMNAGGQVTAIT